MFTQVHCPVCHMRKLHLLDKYRYNVYIIIVM